MFSKGLRKADGARVHRQVCHIVQNHAQDNAYIRAFHDLARNEMTTLRSQPEVRNVFLALEAHGLIPLASEQAVFWHNARTGTRVDLLCADSQSRMLVVVELKTKRSIESAKRTVLTMQGNRNKRVMFPEPFDTLQVSLLHVHELQAVATYILTKKALKFSTMPQIRQLVDRGARLELAAENGCAILCVGAATGAWDLHFVPQLIMARQPVVELMMQQHGTNMIMQHASRKGFVVAPDAIKGDRKRKRES